MSKKEVKTKQYYLSCPEQGDPLSAVWEKGKVTIHHTGTTVVTDTGSGYKIVETVPAWKEPKVTEIDYSLMADLFAVMKILYRNESKQNGEYWDVFEGEKL